MSEVSNRRFVHFDGTREEFISGGYPSIYTDSIVFINEDGNESNNTIYTHGEYYGQSVIVEGDASNSAILKDSINATHGSRSVALGAQGLAGTKGYSYKHIDFDDNGLVSIFVSDVFSYNKPTQSDNNKPNIDESFDTSYSTEDNLIVSDGISFYPLNATEIEHNKISFDASTFPFTQIIGDSGRYFIFCPKKPHVGTREIATCSFAIGNENMAVGETSYAEGHNNISAGATAHAEGSNNFAGGENSHVEGRYNNVYGHESRAEGTQNKVYGNASHVEGFGNRSLGDKTHVEGEYCVAYSHTSHVEGHGSAAGDLNQVGLDPTLRTDGASHAEGVRTVSSGFASHSEGSDTHASGGSSHTEGIGTYARGLGSHAEGISTKSGVRGYYYKGIDIKNKKIYLTTEQPTTIKTSGFVASDIENIEIPWVSGEKIAIYNNKTYYDVVISKTDKNILYVESLPFDTIDTPEEIFAYDFTVTNIETYKFGGVDLAHGSHSEGYDTKAFGFASSAMGVRTSSYGVGSTSNGLNTIAFGDYSHAEGEGNNVSGKCSHAEGYNNTISGDYSHAEGYNNTISGKYSHAEGDYHTISSNFSHAEGYNNTISGDFSHAEGEGNNVSGKFSHAEGDYHTISGDHSHAGGHHNDIGLQTSSSYIKAITLNETKIYLNNTRVKIKYYNSQMSFDKVNQTYSSGQNVYVELIDNYDKHYICGPYTIDRVKNGTPTTITFTSPILHEFDFTSGQKIYYTGIVHNLDNCGTFATKPKYSFVHGRYNTLIKTGFVTGINNINLHDNCFIAGKYNNPSDPVLDKPLFYVGNGIDSKNRSNIFAVTENDVFVKGVPIKGEKWVTLDYDVINSNKGHFSIDPGYYIIHMREDNSIRFDITLTRSSGHYKIIFESMFLHGENNDMLQLHNMHIGTLNDETVLYANGKSMSYDDLLTHKYVELDIICIDDNASNICLGTFAHY